MSEIEKAAYHIQEEILLSKYKNLVKDFDNGLIDKDKFSQEYEKINREVDEFYGNEQKPNKD